ncbi:MAG: pyridoxamine 5'-phosphate oxidase family protein [Woeseiaceae bacterium]
MTHKFADLTFTESVKAAQDQYGSRAHNDRLQSNFGPNDALTAKEIDFIQRRDSFYLSTVSETGWPYVQHRGGPPGFLKVVSSNRLAYADFRGNTQLITVGNAKRNDKCSIILMDYARRRRLKILGHLRVEASASVDDATLKSVALPGYRAQVERVFIIDVAAYDWNCPQHITQRYTVSEFNEKFGLDQTNE